MVADVNPFGASNPTDLVVVGTGLYFTAFDGVKTELWLADAHLGGARNPLASPINPSGSSYARAFGYYRTRGRLLLSADDGWVGKELWSLDARRALPVETPQPMTLTTNLASLNGSVVFGAYMSSTGEDVFASDGITVTALDLQPTVNPEHGDGPVAYEYRQHHHGYRGEPRERRFEPCVLPDCEQAQLRLG